MIPLFFILYYYLLTVGMIGSITSADGNTQYYLNVCSKKNSENSCKGMQKIKLIFY
jgi:hypothetical protein